MTELTKTKQQKDKPILDRITYKGTLSLECKDRLSKASSMEICAQGIEWDLIYILQLRNPKTF